MCMFSFKSILGVIVLIRSVIDLDAQKCEDVKILNGYTRITFGGKVIKFYCNRGFRRLGSRKATCRANEWSKTPPICYAPGCKTYKVIEHGNITKYGTSLMFFECHEGYIVMGYNAAYCNGTSWSAELPKCRVPSEIEYCDFEYETLCGWRQDNDDDFDWKRKRGKTPTGRTGPQNDHTYGSRDKGHYMFLEMSPPRTRGDVARLMSPIYSSNKSGKCFQMWYHMMGPNGAGEVGSLKVILRDASNEDNETTLFEVEGNQGDMWHSADIYIDHISEAFQLIIEGTRKRSYVGDIAVDDLKFYNCTVNTPEITSASETELTTYQTQDHTSSRAPYTPTALVEKPAYIKPAIATTNVTEADDSLWQSSLYFSVRSEIDKQSTESTEKERIESTNITTESSTFANGTSSDLHYTTNAYNVTTSSDNDENSVSGTMFLGSARSTRIQVTKNATPGTSSALNKETLTTNPFTKVNTIFNKNETVTDKSGQYATNTPCNYTVDQGHRTVQHKILSYMKNNVFMIVAVCVGIVCAISAAIAVTVFCRRRKKSYYDDVLEEMKSSFVYKKSVDFTSSKESL